MPLPSLLLLPLLQGSITPARLHLAHRVTAPPPPCRRARRRSTAGAPTAATIAGDGAPTPSSARLHCFGVIPVAGGCSTWPPLAPMPASHHLRHPCSFPTGVALNLSLPLFFRDEQSSSPAPLDALTAGPASARRAQPPPQPARIAPQPQASCFADLGRSPW
ncbi:uncharacterized protein LOC119359769 [Triticum dicoccoides]|uniref:uncharacterized protein LOC119359769 n=1 Tax=Triticum dicoccoides TaxID=85692 RepID=UPI00188FD09E|nr:uncharacterized protein LOC119359769 [Triticum dicoccoides]